MADFQAFLDDQVIQNANLVCEINQLAIELRVNINQQDEVDTRIKTLLLDMCDSIAMLSKQIRHPDVRNTDILPVWRSFLAPITALSRLPSGHFLSARMVLYLSSGLLNQRSLDLKFSKIGSAVGGRPVFRLCREIDDTLLASLRCIWTASGESERFDWVFTQYALQPEDDLQDGASGSRKLAQALSPEELVAMGGIEGRRFIWAMSADERQGDLEEWKPFRGSLPGDATERARYSVPDDDQVKPGECFWKQVGSDGPIRQRLRYYSTASDHLRPASFRLGFYHEHIELLERSCRFILDTRKTTEPCLTDAEYDLVHKALVQVNMPPEIRRNIINHLELPKRHPYLRHFDIAKAYAPYPDNERPCERCTEPATTERDKLTCPESTSFVWNFALRAFLTFHRRSILGDIALCKYGFDCQGHHPDDDWEVENEEEFVNLMETIVKERCGHGINLDQVGLGPSKEITGINQEQLEAQELRLIQPMGPLEDAAAELISAGGFRGLVNSMLYGRVLVALSADRYKYPAQWGLARDRKEYLKAMRLIWSLRNEGHTTSS
ncbi:uncharacterized protein NECHADRAFT_50224 [Fusarium vanettenii 77-13-4]|uniref:Uncharacterized protein n=1 Tax=Fusarium vanettenii (strain ATCC MYA-4622 / CBS 123669 / FGSC 9596 / NRRL 45880 / 77-13-4) TaxID=660122 RepID=C7ZNY4_FUSV7|nr:uncharacterized protein NECHADRAFT_50224 [Fusarium vanettenii 77-13-4]EEU34188.1 hypothetical protein NECHADRAFT_50224 [Fusarium vanettenii 77-13-4]